MSKRDYPKNGFPSVTQVLGLLNKPALNAWMLNNTPEFCRKESARGKAIGTSIHECIQSFIETGKATLETEYEIEVTNALKSFMEFKKDNPDIILTRAEIALTSGYGYNGTIDCTATADKLIICDWKTGKKGDKDKPPIYDEYKYQVAAYVDLYNDVFKTDIDRAIIVAVAKDAVSYNTYKMDKTEIDGCFHEVFLPLLKIWNYQNKGKKNILL